MPTKPKKDKQQLFEETCRRMEGEGYRRTDLTILSLIHISEPTRPY